MPQDFGFLKFFSWGKTPVALASNQATVTLTSQKTSTVSQQEIEAEDDEMLKQLK